MGVLGRIHNLLAEIDVPRAARTRVPEPHRGGPCCCAWTRTGNGTRTRRRPLARRAPRRRPWPTGSATVLAEAEPPLHRHLPRQLVHGDFWDNNVWFQGDDIVLILGTELHGRTRPRRSDSRAHPTTRTRRSVGTRTIRDATRCCASSSSATTAGSTRNRGSRNARALPYALDARFWCSSACWRRSTRHLGRKTHARPGDRARSSSGGWIWCAPSTAGGPAHRGVHPAGPHRGVSAGAVSAPAARTVGCPTGASDEQQTQVGVVDVQRMSATARSVEAGALNARFSLTDSTIDGWLKRSRSG